MRIESPKKNWRMCLFDYELTNVNETKTEEDIIRWTWRSNLNGVITNRYLPTFVGYSSSLLANLKANIHESLKVKGYMRD